MPRLHQCILNLLPILAVGMMLGLGGCAENDRLSYASELDEPNYREGQSLLKSGRRQEALSAFLKVIDKRRDDAPESHLEVGLLYVQHINDPLSAIFHFRKYLALRPNSPQAPLVRQRIDAAIRDFARTLPAQPLESQLQRVDLVATLDRLKQENESLKQQLADAKAGRLQSNTLDAQVLLPVRVMPSDGIKFSVETLPTVRTREKPAAPPQIDPVQSTNNRSLSSTPLLKIGSRTHTVRPGDTLTKLAQQYYNNRAKWRDIYAANRNVMKNDSDLKVGMVLKIP